MCDNVMSDLEKNIKINLQYTKNIYEATLEELTTNLHNNKGLLRHHW